MKPESIKRFEKIGFGIFVHFGLYSVLGKGEWFKTSGMLEDDITNFPILLFRYGASLNTRVARFKLK